MSASKVIDLYSGVGGLSLGAVKAGFELVGAVEIEKRIIDSHGKNFPNAQHINEDVSKMSGHALLKRLNIKKGELAGLIGGPPCQGFSTIGKQNLSDGRNKLFTDFFRLVSETQPGFFLAENVQGIMDPKYDELRKSALSPMESSYYILDPIRIDASEYGAPTKRTRVFFIGVRNDILGKELLLKAIVGMKSPNPVFVKDALAGLPIKVLPDWLSYESSWQEISPCKKGSYIESLNSLIDGIGDKESVLSFTKKNKVSSCFGTKHSLVVAARYESLQPGQQDKISKSVRLKSDGFCPTLRAGTDSTKGSYQAVRPIHPTEARVITPREAARLQGFPDWFQFHETKWHSFRQIGNSVSPIVAEKVLSAIKTTLSL